MKSPFSRIALTTIALSSIAVALVGSSNDVDSPRASAAVAGGSTVQLEVAGKAGVAADASAVVLNLTAVDASANGFVTAWPCGSTRPVTSNLNFVPGGAVANSAIVGVGSRGKVCLYTKSSTELVVDVNGWFPAGSDYQTMTPARLLDTRSGGPSTAGASFAETFTGNVGLDRFDYGLWHRDDHLVSYQSWTGDHDTNCGSPDTQRPIRRDRWQDSFYMCKDHMMTSVGETSGYSLAWFTPKQSFTDETKVSWDVNVTDLGGRQWWEVMIYPESDGDRYSIAAESVDGTECLVCTTEDWIAKTANILPYGPGSIVVGTGPAALEDPHIHFDGGENLYTGGTKICSAGKATWFRDSGACDSKKTRLTFSMTDNQNGTITVNYGGAFTQTITGSFPNEPWRVVFKDHNYTPDKDGTPIGHTWHWDNIIVR
jgi:hypothetical protein